MTRGSKGADTRRSVGERFRVTPIRNLVLEAHDPRRDFDLNADVAAALLGICRESVWRFQRNGRRKTNGDLIFLRAFFPHGSRRSKAYYRLSDLEEFAATAYAVKRDIRYELIPNWYAVRHHRNDLIDGGLSCPVPDDPAPRMETQGLHADERAAVDRGFPRGSYAEGEDVFSLSGIWLNPGSDEPESIREAAVTELKLLYKENS